MDVHVASYGKDDKEVKQLLCEKIFLKIMFSKPYTYSPDTLNKEAH